MNLQHSHFELHFIHGFLGLPSDWETFSTDGIFHNINAYFDHETSSFQSWIHCFQQKISSQNLPKKRVLIAYSLGARLALHCLRDFPKTWDAAILISSNPGLILDTDKELRIKNDEKWAKRFLEEPWENVLNEWNNQSVFAQYKNHLTRREADFNKKHLSKQLTCFSLGRQEDFRPFLKETTTPILWMSGENDSKFSKFSREVKNLSNKNISIEIIPNAGHRVPWENPKAFINQCQQFLNHL